MPKLDGTGAGRRGSRSNRRCCDWWGATRWAAACVAAAFLRNCWQYRRIRSSPFGDLRPSGYRRRFCFAFFLSL